MSGVKFNAALNRLFFRFGETGSLVKTTASAQDDFGNEIPGTSTTESVNYLRVNDHAMLRLFGDGYTLTKAPRILLQVGEIDPSLKDQVLTNFGTFEITKIHSRHFDGEVQYFDLELRDV